MGRNEQYAVMIALISAALGAVFYLGSLDHHVKSNTNAITSLGSKIDSNEAKLESKMNSTEDKLGSKMNSTEAKLESKMNSTEAKLGSKIDSLAQFLRDDVREIRSFYIPLATKFKILERKEEIKQDSENQSVKQKS